MRYSIDQYIDAAAASPDSRHARREGLSPLSQFPPEGINHFALNQPHPVPVPGPGLIHFKLARLFKSVDAV
jgi:hypothetical protein